MRMKFYCYTCEECDCRFAIDSFSVSREPICPNCASEEICDTNECINDAHIVFDRER